MLKKRALGLRTRLVALTVLGLSVLFGGSSVAPAQGQNSSANGPCRPQGAVRGCNAQGKPGQQTCDGAVWTVCRPSPPPPPPPVTGTLKLKYLILMVIYSPPGTNGGRGSSSVNYSSGSTVGTTVSSSDSFKQSNTVSVTASQGILGSSSVGVSFGYTSGSTNSKTTDVKKSNTSEINVVGPGTDGVNHDKDEIWLIRNPRVQLTIFPTASKTASKVVWRLEDTTQNPIFLLVEWLKNPSEIPTGVLNDLQQAGITPSDYPEIMKADLFASSSLRQSALQKLQGPDPNRFQFIGGFPYEPPGAAGDPVPTQKETISQTVTNSTGTSAQQETTVGLSLQGGADFLSLFSVTAKDQNNWTWTSTDTSSTSNGTTESASVTIGGPAFGYQGPIDLGVYYDVIYKTFFFAFLPTGSQATLTGQVKTGSGQPVSRAQVVITGQSTRYRTLTNARGEYRVFRKLSGPLQVQVGGVTKQLPQVPATRRFDIVVAH